MYGGPGAGNLLVLTSSSQTTGNLLFTRSGDHNDTWNYAAIVAMITPEEKVGRLVVSTPGLLSRDFRRLVKLECFEIKRNTSRCFQL